MSKKSGFVTVQTIVYYFATVVCVDRDCGYSDN